MQLLLYTQQEMARLFKTRRGLVVLVLFVMLWTMSMFVIDYLYTSASENLGQLTKAGELYTGPLPMYFVWAVGLFVFPLVPMLLCTDLLVSDLQRGTVRFLLLRSTRTDFVLGRFLGQIINLTVLVYLGMTITLICFTYWDYIKPLEQLDRLAICGANFLILCLPILGMVSLFSTFATKPLRVMLWCMLFWSTSSMVIWCAPDPFGMMQWISYLVPGHQVDDLVQLKSWETFKLAPIAIGQTIIFLALTLRRIKRRDV